MTAELINRFQYEKRIKSASAVALGLIAEALGSTEFKNDVTHAWHRQLIGFQLLARHEPALLGELAALFADNETELAVERAVEALKRLRTTEPTLFWPSKTNQAQVRAWLRRAFVGRDVTEIAGLVDRACEMTRWRERHEAARRLALDGKDVEAIRCEIDRQYPLDGTPAFYQRALAQTKGGLIQGAGPQNLDGDTA